jgi:glycosyltransferase involved in cell wall biosynthesis
MSPLKIFEYMSAGKPIVCSDLPVIREVLEDKKTAFLCDPHNIEEWRDALLILSDENIRNNMSTNARKEFREKYTWQIRSRMVIRKQND